MAPRPLALLALCASLAVASCASENPDKMSFAGFVTGMFSPSVPAPREPASIRLIGAGLGRTATSSLKTALIELGYQVQRIPEERSFPALGPNFPRRETDAIANPATHMCCVLATPFPQSRAMRPVRPVRTRLTWEVSQNWHKY
jgi:hypothetical protein